MIIYVIKTSSFVRFRSNDNGFAVRFNNTSKEQEIDGNILILICDVEYVNFLNYLVKIMQCITTTVIIYIYIYTNYNSKLLLKTSRRRTECLNNKLYVNHDDLWVTTKTVDKKINIYKNNNTYNNIYKLINTVIGYILTFDGHH